MANRAILNDKILTAPDIIYILTDPKSTFSSYGHFTVDHECKCQENYRNVIATCAFPYPDIAFLS